MLSGDKSFVQDLFVFCLNEKKINNFKFKEIIDMLTKALPKNIKLIV